MRLRDDEFLGIRVETNTGRRIGRLVGFVMDANSGFVVQYRVRPKGIVAACVPGLRELLIAHDDVVSLDDQRMVVRDGSSAVSGGGRRKRIVPAMHPQPLSVEGRE